MKPRGVEGVDGETEADGMTAISPTVERMFGALHPANAGDGRPGADGLDGVISESPEQRAHELAERIVAKLGYGFDQGDGAASAEAIDSIKPLLLDALSG